MVNFECEIKACSEGPTWMMKMVMGSFGLYCDGFDPSMTPPWEGALLPVGVGVAAESAEVDVVVDIANTTTTMRLKGGRSGETCQKGKKTSPVAFGPSFKIKVGIRTAGRYFRRSAVVTATWCPSSTRSRPCPASRGEAATAATVEATT
jgi:hypothetical protein